VESEVSGAPVYTKFHPRWYRPRVSTYWWIWRWAYLKFILRELSSVFVAYFVVLTLFLLRALGRGPEAYARFEERLKAPILIALSALAFFFVLFHALTWFHLAPKAMALRMRGKRVPDFLIVLPNYVAWLGISAVVAWLLLRG
jgi:fumarate reductase subunit C